jgi:hypothetical protein
MPPNGEPFYFVSTTKKEALRQVAIYLNDNDCLSGSQVETVKKTTEDHYIITQTINLKNKLREFVVLNIKNVKIVDITDYVSLNSRLLSFLASKNDYASFYEINKSLNEEESTLRSCIAFSLTMDEVEMGFTLSPEMSSELNIISKTIYDNLVTPLELIKGSRFTPGDMSVLFRIRRYL